jgi:hypothetical protein
MNKMSAVIACHSRSPQIMWYILPSVENTCSACHDISCDGTERGERTVQILISIMLPTFLLPQPTSEFFLPQFIACSPYTAENFSLL